MRIGLLFFCLILGTGMPAAFAQEIRVAPDPGVIAVGLGFKGAVVNVSGTAPAQCDIYLKMVSPGRKERLNKKGKVGFLWMNVAQAEVVNVPKMYQIYTSAEIDRLPPLLRKDTGLDGNFAAVHDRAGVIVATEGKTEKLPAREGKEYVDALVGLYKKRGLYIVQEKSLLTKEEKGGQSFSALIKIPAEAAYGETIITAYAIKDGRVIGQSESLLIIQPTGVAGWMRKMAKTNGPLYGTYAVFIALLAGLIIDLLFHFLEKLVYRSLDKKKNKLSRRC